MDEGERSAEAVGAAVRKGIEEEELLTVDHVEVVGTKNLEPLKRLQHFALERSFEQPFKQPVELAREQVELAIHVVLRAAR